MKKSLTKLRNKLPSRSKPVENRITNDTVAEHRERVIAGGKKFKYPIQYARHRLVINAIIISVAALVLVVFIGWWQLYVAQNTSGFMYRVTRVLPVPVASVDGASVRYSDYLMKYRSAEHYLRQKEQVSLTGEDGARQIAYIKQQSMEDAIADTYAAKLAQEQGITVSDVELEEFLLAQRQSPDGEVSQRTYDAVILDYYNWSPDEYRHAMRAKLLRQKVNYSVDDTARADSDAVAALLAADSSDLRVTAESFGDGATRVLYAVSGWVPRTNQDGGLSTKAASLQIGAVSEATTTVAGDGYYFIKLLDTNETQVSYEYIKVPLQTFTQRLVILEDEAKIRYHIEIEGEDAVASEQRSE